ncbi:MAG TPA: LpxD N-terminal domain-containing protein, partial [Gemmatales bacterium]|nr:LpxD N-terminal domain-containing protein [Gemmatales bacterium]
MSAILPLLRASQIAEMVKGILVGEGEIPVTGARALMEAGPGDVSFLADDKQHKNLANRQVSVLIARPGTRHGDTTIIEVEDPFGAFLQVYRHFHPEL